MTVPDSYQQRPNPPRPERRPGRGAQLFTILSGIVSLLFIFYGVTLLLAASGAGLLGALTFLYGFMSLALLGCAHRYRARWCLVICLVGAIIYLLAYVGALSAGVATGLGVGGILAVALGLWCNWFALNRILRQPA